MTMQNIPVTAPGAMPSGAGRGGPLGMFYAGTSQKICQPRPYRPCRTLWLLAAGSVLLLGSCVVGPDYQRPELAVPTTYKSAATQGGATPPTTMPKLGLDWWRLFRDPELDTLEQAALQANTDLQAAVARVAESRAATRGVQSQFYPVVGLNPSAVRSRSSAHNAAGRSTTGNNFQIPFDVSYE
ncbi:MAG: TolC family protein, partial [Phycisphaerae bacterium]